MCIAYGTVKDSLTLEVESDGWPRIDVAENRMMWQAVNR
jgi:hypothetical protein